MKRTSSKKPLVEQKNLLLLSLLLRQYCQLLGNHKSSLVLLGLIKRKFSLESLISRL